MAEQQNFELPTDRQARILEAGIQLFGVKGYKGTSMRDIAAQVGLLPGSLYAHISSKDDILAAIVQSGNERFLKIRDEIEALDGTPEEKIREAIKRHIQLLLQDRERALVTIHQWRYLKEPSRSKSKEQRRQYARMFIDILDEAAQAREGNFKSNRTQSTKILAFMILGALNSTTDWYSPYGLYSPTEIAENLAEDITVLLKL